MNEYQEAQKQISRKDQKGKACDDGIWEAYCWEISVSSLITDFQEAITK